MSKGGLHVLMNLHGLGNVKAIAIGPIYDLS